MRFRQSVLGIAAWFFASVSGADAKPPEHIQAIRIPVKQADIAGVEACINSGSEDCRKCRIPGQSNLSLMNYTLLREALTAGGITAEVVPVQSPNSERSRKMIRAGIADVKTDWVFNISPAEGALKTAPLFQSGEIEKGLYARPGFMADDLPETLEDIGTLRAVGIRTWRLDWQVLESLPVASLISAATTRQMFSLIDAGRADFTLLEFSSQEDMGREIDGIWLYPITGIKVSLPATQHFMVSDQLEDANKVVAALDRGIRVMRDNGFIHRCLVNNGVINPAVENWHNLNSPHATTKPAAPAVSTQ